MTSTALEIRVLLPNEVGFDYAKTALEINHAGWSYEKIAGFCGYADRTAIAKIVGGAMPSHRAGEALYILYVELFGRKPPLNVAASQHDTST